MVKHHSNTKMKLNTDFINMVASDYRYAVPAAITMTLLFFYLQRSSGNGVEEKKRVIDKGFMIQNALFVGLLVGLFMYFGKNSRLEDSIVVRPAVM